MSPRDVARIDKVIDLLRKAWHRDPDQRLGQLLTNLGRDEIGHIVDVWHIEDDEWEQRLRNIVQNGWPHASNS